MIYANRNGCSSSPDPALSREEIEKYWLSYSDEDIEESKKNGWWSERCQMIIDHLRAGGHIHDERGILLPEWKQK